MARKRKQRQPKSVLDEPLKLVKLGVTSTVLLGTYSATLNALSKIKK